MVVNWNAVGIFAAFTIYGAFVAYTLRRPLAKVLARLRAMPRISQVAACVFVAVATVQAQKQSGSTNEPPLNAPGPGGGLLGGMHVGPVLRPLPQLRLIGGGGSANVSAEDVARGYCMVCETNDACHAYAMPTNAVFLGNAHIRGAASGFGMNVVDFGAWSFPFGSNGVLRSRLWWFPDGRVRAMPHDATDEISAGVEGALAMQGESHLWWAEGEDDCRILTWEGVFAGGDTNAALNLQVVLGGGGDWFETWSNDVGRVYARLDPDDWDGDGLDNAIDALPTASDGDCFGTGVDWLNANCSGVLSASEGTNGEVVVAWHTNSNENAYYWLQFTATQDRTRVTIECDGPSNLGDMVVIANSNQVCRVPLLIGARYHVRASPPVDDVSVSDPEAFISYLRSVGEFYVERPIELYFAGDDDSGTIVSDPDIGVAIGAITGNCCEVSFNAGTYTWTCCGNCHCTGYGQNWNVTAAWEGYCKLFPWWAQCDCQAENESNPDRWFSLSCPSVIMKNGYSHTVSGSFDPPCATNATMTLTCVQGSDKIRVLSSGDAWMVVQGSMASGMEGDVLFELSLDLDGNTYAVTQALTVAEVKYLHMESELKDTEKNNNQPPFDGETAYPFSETNSPAADRHIAIPFYRVVDTNDFSVEDFSVNMRLELNPDVSSPYNAEWQILSNTTGSGGLANKHGLCADFANPKHGGVIRLRSRVDGSPWTEGNIVLPLSGASIDSILESDLAAYAALMDWLVDNYNQDERNSISFGEFWFVNGGNGDYIGRPDSAARPTVWLYNQVNDEPTPTVKGVGFGAVMTWHGVPTLLSKVGNLFVSFGTKRIGVSEWRRQLSRMWYGTNDFFFGDGTSSMSWEAGNTLSTTNFAQVTGPLVTNMWLKLGKKERRLWPNTANADNHVQWSETFDYNRQFISPTTVELGMEILNQQQGD